MTDDYDDIINLPHHVSAVYKPMPLLSRAAQFAPFAALTGYGQSGKYWMKRLNPTLMMNPKKEKANKVTFDSSFVS